MWSQAIAKFQSFLTPLVASIPEALQFMGVGASFGKLAWESRSVNASATILVMAGLFEGDKA